MKRHEPGVVFQEIPGLEFVPISLALEAVMVYAEKAAIPALLSK